MCSLYIFFSFVSWWSLIFSFIVFLSFSTVGYFLIFFFLLFFIFHSIPFVFLYFLHSMQTENSCPSLSCLFVCIPLPFPYFSFIFLCSFSFRDDSFFFLLYFLSFLSFVCLCLVLCCMIFFLGGGREGEEEEDFDFHCIIAMHFFFLLPVSLCILFFLILVSLTFIYIRCFSCFLYPNLHLSFSTFLS